MPNWVRRFQGDSDRLERVAEWERLAEEFGVERDVADRLYERALETVHAYHPRDRQHGSVVLEHYVRLLEKESDQEPSVRT